MDRLMTLAVDDQHFRTDDGEASRLEGAVVRLQRQLSDQKKRASVMLATIGDEALDYELTAYKTAKANILVTTEALSRAQEEFTAAKGHVSPAEHIVRVKELRARMDGDDPQAAYAARLLTKTALAGIVDQITFYAGLDPFGGSNGLVWVELIHGVGSLFIRPGEEAQFVESGDTREHGSRASLASAAGNTDEVHRIEAYVRRRAA